MEDSNAWMVSFRGDHRAAVGERELVHVLPDTPPLFPVMKAPRHCRQVFVWEGHVLPVYDLSMWLGAPSAHGDDDHLGVFRYRPAAGAPLAYGALVIEGAPRQVLVNDSQARELPEDAKAWRPVVDACFDYGGRAVPVLNLARLFGTPL